MSQREESFSLLSVASGSSSRDSSLFNPFDKLLDSRNVLAQVCPKDCFVIAPRCLNIESPGPFDFRKVNWIPIETRPFASVVALEVRLLTSPDRSRP